jgi:hypothetical protein
MSNQIGLLLSFVFLSFFIILSGEILAYQQTSAKTFAMTTQIALHVEKHGYSEEELENLEFLEYLDEINVTSSINELDGYVKYDITVSKQYNAFSSMYDYLNQDIVCKMSVYRKE